MSDLIDLLLHRRIWNGDTIHIYQRQFEIGPHGGIITKDEFMSAHTNVKVNDGAVWVYGPPRSHTIRRDLPQWDPAQQCWTYHYTEGSGA